ncbi:MAG: hypothetical protein QHJ34_03060 [bacterium]|jgi:hypothetical protein|nr:hypothetical protein [bacterium]
MARHLLRVAAVQPAVAGALPCTAASPAAREVIDPEQTRTTRSATDARRESTEEGSLYLVGSFAGNQDWQTKVVAPRHLSG